MKDRGQSLARRLHLELGILVAVLALMPVRGQDVFQTKKDIPSSPASPFFNAPIPAANAPGHPLTLPDAVECAFYNNPQTRQAWADIN